MKHKFLEQMAEQPVVAPTSAPLRLGRMSYEHVARCMLIRSPGINRHWTLPNLIDETVTERGSLPDAFVFTANSAIPLADAIRGYYDKLRQAEPRITHVKANRTLAKQAEIPNPSPAVTQVLDEEAARLADILSSSQNVCVVDQFTETGATLNLGQRIVSSAVDETTPVTPIGGRWYMQAGHVNLETMSSRDADFMYEVGLIAGQLSLANIS